jgi:O-antigen ligase
VALIGLLAPFAILISARDTQAFQRSALQWIAGLGIVNIAVGTVQLTSGRQLLNWYGGGNPAHLYGTFANHNSAGLFLVIALCALLGVRSTPTPSHRAIKSALGILLAAGVFLTQSRSSIALLIIPAIQLLLQYLRRDHGSPVRAFTAMVSFLIILGTLGALAAGNSKAGEILQRFDDLRDPRPMIWDDSRAAIARYWPVGSGVGTFDEVFQVDESLENVNGHLAGRAHSEYLEVLLENGIFGAFLTLSWIVYIVIIGFRSFYKNRSCCLAPISILVAVSMQSFLDYPLRNQAIMCVTAAMIALLAFEGERARNT